MITQRGAKRPPLPTVRRLRLALGLAMGKKSRAVPGRRPILQLSPPGPRSSTPGRDPEPEPDAELESTATAPNQPTPPTPPPPTTAAVTAAVTAAAAPEESPSEGKGERGAPTPRWGVRNPRSIEARGLHISGRALGGRETRRAASASEAYCAGPARSWAAGPKAAEPCAPIPGGAICGARIGPCTPRLVSVHARFG